MSFWYEFPEENRENDIQHPSLTDATVASIETRFHVRFPQRLIALLREKNGGYLRDKEFKLKGEDHQVDCIFGLAEKGRSIIIPLSCAPPPTKRCANGDCSTRVSSMNKTQLRFL